MFKKYKVIAVLLICLSLVGVIGYSYKYTFTQGYQAGENEANNRTLVANSENTTLLIAEATSSLEATLEKTKERMLNAERDLELAEQLRINTQEKEDVAKEVGKNTSCTNLGDDFLSVFNDTDRNSE